MRSLARDRRGIATVELAMVSPFLFLLLVGFLDVVYLGRGHLRVQTTATQVGQVVSQCKSIGSGDQAQIIALAQRTLRPFLERGRNWGVVVTAIRLNAQGQPRILWTMDNRTPGMRAYPRYASDGAALPANLTLGAEHIIFRTEVFAEIDATLFTARNSLLGDLMGNRLAVGNAASSVLHIGRAANADPLNTMNSAEACLS